MSNTVSAAERYRGALLGLAAGDALGTTLEFTRPGSFAPISDIVGGGPFGLAPGQWTDDTSMALCLAASLVERGDFDLHDQITRYVRWWQTGYMSSTGRCFDIGNATRAALARFLETGEPRAGSSDPGSAGNGSIMRLAPAPLAYAADPQQAIGLAAESSRATHQAEAAVDACRYLAGLLVGAVRGASKDELLAPRYSPLPGLWEAQPLHPAIDAIAAGSFWAKEPHAIRGSGYVVDSLEAALWAFQRSSNFREGCLLAVNLGDDADTTGAVYGQLAGAFYGEAAIPQQWRERLAERATIEALADGLLHMERAAR
jgi:ADP-ribosyl-[dinitrogen reductase] hydrolase